MADTDKPNPRKVKTSPFRMSYPAILKPRENKDDDGKVTKKYELSLLLPPGTDLKPYEAALKAAMTAKFGEDTKVWPRLRHKPVAVLKDFEAFNAEAKSPLPGDWKGWTLIRTSAPEDRPPGVVGPAKGTDGKFPKVSDARDVYAGRWARATIEAFYFAHKGGGVTFALVNVQLLKHDTSFGSGVAKPEDDFDDAEASWAGVENGAEAAKTDGDGWD